jgi:hypothetical protein
MLSTSLRCIPHRLEKPSMNLMGSMAEIQTSGIQTRGDQLLDLFLGIAGRAESTDNLNFSSR